MKTFSLATTSSIVLLLLACNHHKKSTASTPTANSSSTQMAGTPVVAGPVMAAKPANGVHMPGDEELNAIRPQYNDITLQTLEQGYGVYVGPCKSCHEAKNVYPYSDVEWNQIMTDMAMRAHLNSSDKAAVWAYVMAVRAVKSDKK